MTGSQEGAFRELSGLLFGAKERTARLALRSSSPSTRPWSRRLRALRADGRIGHGHHREGWPSVREDLYHEHQGTEEVDGLWYERPERWREEVRDAATGELYY